MTRKFISRSRAPLPVMEAGPPFGMEKSSTTERKNTAALSSKTADLLVAIRLYNAQYAVSDGEHNGRLLAELYRLAHMESVLIEADVRLTNTPTPGHQVPRLSVV